MFCSFFPHELHNHKIIHKVEIIKIFKKIRESDASCRLAKGFSFGRKTPIFSAGKTANPQIQLKKCAPHCKMAACHEPSVTLQCLLNQH